jgi:hypothetical protein
MSLSCREVIDFIKKFTLKGESLSQPDGAAVTQIEYVEIDGKKIPRFINEFWTSKQRQASSIHEVSYRACFKPQLPRFFINLLTKEGDTVYDPFSGRGTTVIQAGMMGRKVISNDINPLSRIMTMPRFFVPDIKTVTERLCQIPYKKGNQADIDISMFYHPETEAELTSLKNYLQKKNEEGKEDHIDSWIRMVATNRLTGHSPGFFSVYTLPPNQAVTPDRQIKINEDRNQKPEYRDIKKLILRKTKSLIRNLKRHEVKNLSKAGEDAVFLTKDARFTKQIPDETVNLTVTSPPFLDIVQYDKDNWLRCWFNGIDAKKIAKKITMSKNVEEWSSVMQDVFFELFRITKKGGWVAFEVGEVKRGKVKLDEYVVPLGLNAGFKCMGILINLQEFTKTSNIWGVKNNKSGTNTNRIVLFVKE